MKKLLLFASLLLTTVVVWAEQASSADRLTRMDRAFQQYVDEARIGGAVALVLQDGKPIYERAFGWSDKEAGRKMTTDTIFRIDSQTKALTSVAILSLMEEGKIGLNDPAGRYIRPLPRRRWRSRTIRARRRSCRRNGRSRSAIC